MSAFLLFLTPSTLLAGEAVPDIEEIHDGSNYRKEPDSRQGLSVWWLFTKQLWTYLLQSILLRSRKDKIQPKYKQQLFCPMRHFGGFHLIFVEGVSFKWSSRRIFLISWVPQDHILELGHKEFPWPGLPWCYRHTSPWLHDLCVASKTTGALHMLPFCFCLRKMHPSVNARTKWCWSRRWRWIHIVHVGRVSRCRFNGWSFFHRKSRILLSNTKYGGVRIAATCFAGNSGFLPFESTTRD